MSNDRQQKLGAVRQESGGCDFLVWAPKAGCVDLHVAPPSSRFVPMQKEARGYFSAHLADLEPDSLYTYRLDGLLERPDPASRFQPSGVHGPSQIVDPRFEWHDRAWHGLQLSEYVLYEMHVGTFTEPGTFTAIIPRLQDLKDLGVTALELMPVAQFPGSRNWGYDGVYPFAVQQSYGGPLELKKLVDASHAAGIAVVLDVVYNHLGPEGNYFGDFAPYFTDLYRTPWGSAINFDQAGSDEVRRYFIENALYWIDEFHLDALRLDAVHAIRESSARPFLRELAEAVHRRAAQLGRHVHLMPESNQNDSRLVAARSEGGLELDAQWNDDFHHAVHALLTGEKDGYYRDFGSMEHLVRAFSKGFVYSGQYSEYRGRRHGNSSESISAERLVVFAQNHDQIGNRVKGDRLAATLPFDRLRLAAGLTMASPYLPLLFMGEEYGEKSPFQYFVSHGDPALIQAVREGRRKEFSQFDWSGELPDAQEQDTFLRSRLNWDLRLMPPHSGLLALYKELLRLRREHPVWSARDKKHLEVTALEKPKVLFLRRWTPSAQALAIFHFEQSSTIVTELPPRRWKKILDSCETAWGGVGLPFPATLDSAIAQTLTLPACSFAFFDDVGEER